MTHIPQNQEFDNLQIVFERNPSYLKSKHNSLQKFKKAYLKTKPSFWQSIVMGFQSLFRQTTVMETLTVFVIVLGFGFVAYLVSDLFNLQPDINHNVLASDDCNLGIKYPREISGFPVKVNQVKTEDKVQINISGQDKVSDDSTVRDLNIYCYNQFDSQKYIDSKNFEMKALSKDEFAKNVPSLGLDNVSDIQEMIVSANKSALLLENNYTYQSKDLAIKEFGLEKTNQNQNFIKDFVQVDQEDGNKVSIKNLSKLSGEDKINYNSYSAETFENKLGADNKSALLPRNFQNSITSSSPGAIGNNNQGSNQNLSQVINSGQLNSSQKTQNQPTKIGQKNNLRNIFFKQDGKVKQIQFLDQTSIGGDTLKGVFASQIKLGPESRVVIQNTQADNLKYKSSPLVPTATHSVAVLDSCNLALKYQTSSPDPKKVLSINYPKKPNVSTDSSGGGNNDQNNIQNGTRQSQSSSSSYSQKALTGESSFSTPLLPGNVGVSNSSSLSGSQSGNSSQVGSGSDSYASRYSSSSSKNPDFFANESSQEGVVINDPIDNQTQSQISSLQSSSSASSYSPSQQLQSSSSSLISSPSQESISQQNLETPKAYIYPEKLQHVKVIRQYDSQESVSVDCFKGSVEQEFLMNNQNVKSLQPFKPYFFDPETFASIQNYKIYKVVNPKNTVGLEDIMEFGENIGEAKAGVKANQSESQWVVFFDYEGIFYQIKFYFIDSDNDQTLSSYITPDVAIQIDSLSPSIGEIVYSENIDI